MSRASWQPKHFEDYRLWEDWHKSGRDPKKLKPLMDRLRPLIESRAAQFRQLESIPYSTVKAELYKQTLKALETYDPNRNVPLSVHVSFNLRGANKFVYDYQNLGRIPAARVRKVGDFKAAFSELESKLGRPPTSHELADKLGWPVSEVTRMTTQLRQDLLPIEGSKAEEQLSPTIPAVREVMELLPYELDPFELSVYEYTFGYGGKPQLETKDIAKVLKTHPSKVYRAKSNIAKKLDTYLTLAEMENVQGFSS